MTGMVESNNVTMKVALLLIDSEKEKSIGLGRMLNHIDISDNQVIISQSIQHTLGL